MIETDMIYAYVKEADHLKLTADILVKKIEDGDFGTIYASREALHELYYVSMEEGVSLDEFILRAASLTEIPNLRFLDTTREIDLLAFTLIKQYNLSSIFDAYHAATALNQVEDHTIISTDRVFDLIPGIKRVDPARLLREQ